MKELVTLPVSNNYTIENASQLGDITKLCKSYTQYQLSALLSPIYENIMEFLVLNIIICNFKLLQNSISEKIYKEPENLSKIGRKKKRQALFRIGR
jgi:hypothetical protein